MSDMPTNGPSLDDIAAQLAHQNVSLPDPTPSPMDVHRQKLESLINNACAVALEHERFNVEGIQALMRAIQAKRDHLAELIHEYLEEVQAVTDQCKIISDAVNEMARRVGPVVIEPKPNGRKRS